MAIDILKGGSGTPLVFLMVQSSDHITGLTGASPTVTISKNGAAFASPSGAVTEISSGWYKVAGNATDTNTAGPLALHATATSGDPTDIMAANIIDATVAVYGTNSVNWVGGAIPAVNVTGVPLVDLKYTLGTLSPAAAGSVSPDWGQVVNKTTTNALTGTTISTSQTVATVTNQLTAAQIATGVWQDTTAGDFTTASSIGKSLYTSGVVPGGSGGLFISGSNAATTVNFTGNLSGSVGSVTGAVGSVTGNVGGNVVGSVASVTGAVGSVTGAVGSVTAGVTVSTNNDKTAYTLTSAYDFAKGTVAMTESYAAANAAPTPAQLLFEARALLAENNVSGTTVTTKKIDGATTAHTYTINSSTAPTSITTTS